MVRNMTAARTQAWRRWFEQNPLVLALLLSVVIHLGLLGGWRLGKKLGWWNHQAGWLAKLTEKLTASKPRFKFPLQPKPPSSPPENREIPLTFLEVDPDTAVDRAPENAKFYSDKNALASNLEPDTKPTPKVDGVAHRSGISRNERPGQRGPCAHAFC